MDQSSETMNKYELNISFKGAALVKVFLQSYRTATKAACGGVNDMNELNVIEKYRKNYIRKSKRGKFHVPQWDPGV